MSNLETEDMVLSEDVMKAIGALHLEYSHPAP
jgi:hypothetical protein